MSGGHYSGDIRGQFDALVQDSQKRSRLEKLPIERQYLMPTQKAFKSLESVLVQATVTEYHGMNGWDNKHLFLTVLEAGRPCWPGAGNGPLLVHRQLTSHSIFPWIRRAEKEQTVMSSLKWILIPPWGLHHHDTITSPETCFLIIASHWELGFQHTDSRRTHPVQNR